MAVEASRIKGRFKELFPKANLSTKRLDALAARLATKPADGAEDSAIDEVLNDANGIFPFDDMAKEEHRLTNAENKLKLQKPTIPADEEEDTPPGTPPTPPADNEPAWAKKLAQDIAELKSGKVKETKLATATELFNKNETLKGLKETVKPRWLARINVDSETPIEDQIAELETEYSDLVQVTADNKRTAGAPPNGAANGKPTEDEVSKVAGML